MENELRAPRLVRPLYNEYLTIGGIINNEEPIYDMTEQQFVATVMQYSRGSFNPDRAKTIYKNLMLDAGLKPI
jgi:hypothetical protein